MIVAVNAHPLIVPRVRDYFEHDLKLDEATRSTWIHHWLGEALKANLSASPETGRYRQGDAITVADIYLVSDATAAISSGSIWRRIRRRAVSSARACRTMPSRGRIP